MALVVAIVVGGCAVADPILKPGWRHIIVPVENEMARPVFVVVARNQMPPITVVGTAEPGTVPAGQTVDVSLGLPPDPDWAIYVNPGPNQGAMFLPGDIPDNASGRTPLSVHVGSSGVVGARVTGPDSGWMGNP